MRPFIILSLFVFLSACGTSFGGSSEPKYVWIGCHTVDEVHPGVLENPSEDGSYAFGLYGLPTSRVFFKQVNIDGTVSKTFREKCSD